MEFEGARVLVTGGAVRIGRAMVEALAAEGCRCAIHYRSSGDEAVALAEAIEARGGTAVALHSGLENESDCGALVTGAREQLGGLDVLINNASLFNKHALTEASEAGISEEFRVNLFVPMLLTAAMARACESGVVINMLDRRVSGWDPTCTPYLLSKKGLADFTRNAALELAPTFRVNGVAPGDILPPPGEGQEYIRRRVEAIPLKRAPGVDEIVQAALYLIRADSVTGQVIYVDGGRHLSG